MLTGEHHPRWAGPRYCKVCGIELFERRQRQKWCCKSKECSRELRSRVHRGSKNGRWLGGQIFCKQCGKEITHRARLRAVFCSRACGGKWNSENKSGPNSYAWKGDERADGFYPLEWTPKLRHRIRTRDGFRCRKCETNEWPLDVHHIDKNKGNCASPNLITLCRSCHRYVESGSKQLPSDWERINHAL